MIKDSNSPSSLPHSSKQREVEFTSSSSSKTSNKQLFQREEQFFGFNLLSFLDEINTSSDDFSASEIDQIEQELEKCKELKGFEKEVQLGIDKLLQFVQNSFDKNFDLFEMYALRNIFHLPKNFDLEIPSQNSKTEEQLLEANHNLDLEIEELKKNIEELYTCNLKLKNELNSMEEENKKLQSCSGYLQFITNTCKSSDIQDVTQTSKNISDQMTELLGLMQTMNM